MGGRGSSSVSSRLGIALTQQEQQYLDIRNGGPIVNVDGKDLCVPDWVREQNELGMKLFVKRETEKAILVQEFDTAARGRHNSAWVAKSLLQTKKEYASKGLESDRKWLERRAEKRK